MNVLWLFLFNSLNTEDLQHSHARLIITELDLIGIYEIIQLEWKFHLMIYVIKICYILGVELLFFILILLIYHPSPLTFSPINTLWHHHSSSTVSPSTTIQFSIFNLFPSFSSFTFTSSWHQQRACSCPSPSSSSSLSSPPPCPLRALQHRLRMPEQLDQSRALPPSSVLRLCCPCLPSSSTEWSIHTCYCGFVYKTGPFLYTALPSDVYREFCVCI